MHLGNLAGNVQQSSKYYGLYFFFFLNNIKIFNKK